MAKMKSGLYWLCHHKGPLIEWVWDEDKRRKYIDKYKPVNELAIRQLCFQLVKGKLPVDVAAAYKVYDDARKVYDDAYKVYDDAYKVFGAACKVYDDARKVYDDACKTYDDACKTYDAACKVFDDTYEVFGAARKVYDDACKVYGAAYKTHEKVIALHKVELEAQYALEYPEAAKYWNGNEIVFPKESEND